jgi:hypothetical protein
MTSIDTTINRADPLAQGLIFALCFARDSAAGPIHDLIRNTAYMPNGSPPYLFAPGPYGGQYTRRQVSVDDFDFPLGVCTVAVVERVGSFPDSGGLLHQIAFLGGNSYLPQDDASRVWAWLERGTVNLQVGTRTETHYSADWAIQGQWHHFAFQWGTDARIFQDGVLMASAALPGSRGGALPWYAVNGVGYGARLFINGFNGAWTGSGGDGGTFYDCLFVWDRELTPQEIADHAANPYRMFGPYGIHISATISPYDTGRVRYLDLLDGGHGYSTPPDVVFSGGWFNTTASPTPPTAHTEIGGGQVTRIILDTMGQNYNVAPLVALVGGGGTDARVQTRLRRTIVRTEFYFNGTKIGQNAQPPFDMLWLDPPLQLQAMGCPGGLTSQTGIITAALISNIGRQDTTIAFDPLPPA